MVTDIIGVFSSTEACVTVLQEMNPLVTVTALRATMLNAAAVREFHVVCFTGGSLVDQITLNELCREAGVKFCCARCTGPFGWMFLDLMHHAYTSDVCQIYFSREIMDALGQGGTPITHPQFQHFKRRTLSST